ncbi:MAG: helix-turn-helix domain-containing protein [Pontiellaceae bacterium]|jgi:uncharacterized Zn finger protein|nr:helix-turn-helix domain-containing protein [Pontiellaceae bacterium]
MSWFYYERRPSVAECRQNAAKKIEKLRKEGEIIQPIEPFRTRSIAVSFWGQAWCRHLEAFSDYANRLPRGRSYVRNGSVCHLAIEKGTITALVSGSSLYKLSIHIQPLDTKQWESIKSRCKGGIGSLIELLQGKISDEIMTVVTDKQNGLFPQPKEIRFNCDCPDWADMCKHVAAVMYGVGVRLDTHPELLFKLRGVNHEELILMDTALDGLTDGTRSRRRRTLDGSALENVFDIELEEKTESVAAIKPAKKSPFKPTGAAVRKLRKQTGLSVEKFAAEVGVSKASITRWENTKGPLKLQSKSPERLQHIYEEHQLPSASNRRKDWKKTDRRISSKDNPGKSDLGRVSAALENNL